MAHQNVLNTIQANLRYFMDNNNAENVFHVKATGPITDTLLDSLAVIILNWVHTTWAPDAAAEWVAKELILTGLNSLADPRKSYPLSPGVPGTNLTGALPANCTVAVKEDVGRRGKGIAGRWFWVGLASDQCTTDDLTAAAATQIVADLNTLASSIAGTAGFEGICVPHMVVGGVRPPNASSDVITGFLLSDDSLDSQKDRLPFHKKHKRFPVA